MVRLTKGKRKERIHLASTPLQRRMMVDQQPASTLIKNDDLRWWRGRECSSGGRSRLEAKEAPSRHSIEHGGKVL